MTQSEFAGYRPPERPRRRREGKDRPGRRRGGPQLDLSGSGRGSGGDREMPMVAAADFTSYYGKPIVKAPPWGTPIAIYLFVGGLAGGCGLLQAGAHVSGRPALRRNSRLTALAALGVGTSALIVDLGRPDRFLHMLRTIKPTSPMSLGTWILTAYGVGAGLTGAAEFDRMTGERIPLGVLRRLRPGLERLGTVQSALLGAPLAAYTAVLLGDTAMPTWHGARTVLPFLFVSSASLAAGGAGMITTPVAEAAPARRLAVAGVLGDLVSARALPRSMHPVEAEPLHEGKPGRWLKAAEVLTVAGGIGALLGRRSRLAAVAAGAALLGASALTRFAILQAGLDSAQDPRYTVQPQKDRLAARRARGQVGDSITTGPRPDRPDRSDEDPQEP